MVTTTSKATACVSSARMEAICAWGEARGMENESFEVVVQAWFETQKAPTSVEVPGPSTLQ